MSDKEFRLGKTQQADEPEPMDKQNEDLILAIKEVLDSRANRKSSTAPEFKKQPEEPPIEHKKANWQPLAIILGVLMVWGAGILLLWQTTFILALIIPTVFGVGVIYQMFFRDPFGKSKLRNILGGNTGIAIIKSPSRINKVYFVDFNKPYFTIDGHTYMLASGQKSFLRGVTTLEFEEGGAEPLKPLIPTEERQTVVKGQHTCKSCGTRGDVELSVRLPVREQIPAPVMTSYLTTLEELSKALLINFDRMLLFAIIAIGIMSFLLSLYNVIVVQGENTQNIQNSIAGLHASINALNQTISNPLPVV